MFHLIDKTGRLSVATSFRLTNNSLSCKRKGLIAAGVCMLLIMAGCKGPQMASRPLSQQEKEWVQAMHEFYPGWKPPRYPPPINTGGQGGRSESADWNKTPGSPSSGTADSKTVPGTTEEMGLDSIQFVPVGGTEGSANRNEKGMRLYRVRKGDNLSEISRKFYDTASKWREIYDANKGKMSSPTDLTPGMQLNIPPE